MKGPELAKLLREIGFEKVKTHKNEFTYSVITEGGKKDMIVVGGLAVAHATDAIEHTKIMKRLDAPKIFY